jgi:radical SAM protein with 4Fe4S-binding SPASM domain
MSSRAVSERIPLWAHVEIIATCNFNCQHCYIAPCADRKDVMSLEQATILFEKLRNAGTLSLLLTGGEVFTHRNFKEIYLEAKRSGFLVYVNTNAYLINERWADFLAEWPPSVVSISVYGTTDERYEEVTGIPNAFRRVDRAIKLLLDRGVKVELKCPAFSATVKDLPALKAYAAALGQELRYDVIMIGRDDGGTEPFQLQLSPKAVLELEQQMDPSFESYRTFADRFGGSSNGQVYSCGAGRISLAVNVHGGVSTCLSSRQVVGNIFEQPFEEVWAMLGGKVAKRFPDGHPCATCKFRTICAGCPATVEQATGLPEGYVQQYCQITHLRAHRIGLHPTGVPLTVEKGIPDHVVTPPVRRLKALPVLS